MIRFSRLAAALLCAALASLPMAAQTTGSNVRFYNFLPSTSSTGTINLNTGVLPNIGQTSHGAQVQVTGNWSGQATFQGSNDGSTWFNIGATVHAGSANVSNFSLVGYGAYPYVRILGQVSAISGSITAVGYYTGTSSGGILTDSWGSAQGMLMTWNPTNSVTGAGTQQTVLLSPATSAPIYGLSMFTSGSLTNVTLSCAGTTVLLLNVIPTSLVLPLSERPYGVCLPGLPLTLTTSGTGSIELNIYYRFEN